MQQSWGIRPNKRPRGETDDKRNLPLSNRFELLNEQHEENEDDMDENEEPAEKRKQTTSHSIPDKNKKRTMPPIILTKEIDDYSKFIQTLKTFIKNEPRIFYSKYKLTIITDSQADFDIVKRELEIAEVPFHTYPEKQYKPKKHVANGLPDVPTEEIIADLDKKGIKCQRVITLKKRDEASEGSPIYLIDFPNNTDMKAVRNFRYLCYVRVYWENYNKRRKATQCFKCQRFGHTAEYCNNDPNVLSVISHI